VVRSFFEHRFSYIVYESKKVSKKVEDSKKVICIGCVWIAAVGCVVISKFGSFLIRHSQ